MRPVLFYIGSIPVYSYVIFVLLAYFAGLFYAWREVRRTGEDPIYAVDLSLVIFISGFVGARLLFVFTAWERFRHTPAAVFRLWEGGFVFYGGLILAVLAAAVYIRRRRLPLGIWADILAPTAMLALLFGRMGCFLNGCCYGKRAPGLLWGVIYPTSHPALGLVQIEVHPAPLYEAAAAFLIFLLLLGLKAKRRTPGELFFVMIILYSAARLGLEFFRADPGRGKVLFTSLSLTQAIAAVLVILGALGFAIRERQARYLSPPAASADRAAKGKV